MYLDAANIKSYPGSGTTWTDMSGNGNNGTLVNGPSFSSNSILFDGVNDYVTLGNNKLQYQSNFTLETFSKFPNLPNNPGSQCGARYPIIYNHDYGYNLLIGTTGLLVFQIYNTSSAQSNVVSMAPVTGSNFFHSTAIKNGTTISLYLNGVLQNSKDLSTNSVYYSSNPFVIGGHGICGGNRFYSNGNISVVKVYNRTLSADEVLQNFNAQKSRFGL